MSQLLNTPATRGARRAARTRAAILDAAEQSFRRDGYRGSRIEVIAEDADVSIGSIYNHFGDKDGLYAALAERSLELFAQYMEAAYAAGTTPLEQVMACGDAYLRFHLEHPGAFRFLAFTGVEGGPAAHDANAMAGILDEFEATLQRAIDIGEVRPELDAWQLSRFLWGGWNGVVALGLRADPLELTEEQIAAVIQTGRKLVVEGLVRPSARGAGGDARVELVSIASPAAA